MIGFFSPYLLKQLLIRLGDLLSHQQKDNLLPQVLPFLLVCLFLSKASAFTSAKFDKNEPPLNKTPCFAKLEIPDKVAGTALSR